MQNKIASIVSNYKYFYFSSFEKFYQCEINLQRKIQVSQQHNQSKLNNKKIQNKRNNYHGQKTIMALQKKIFRRLN